MKISYYYLKWISTLKIDYFILYLNLQNYLYFDFIAKGLSYLFIFAKYMKSKLLYPMIKLI